VTFAGYQLPHPLVNEMKIKARALLPLLPLPPGLLLRAAARHVH
jgi:DNA-directed RNA polymerase subunit L